MVRLHQQRFENADYRRMKQEIGRERYEHERHVCERREAWDDERHERRHAVESARKAVDAAERSWQDTADRYINAYSSQKVKLAEVKHRYLNLQAEQQAELRELGKNVEQIQLQQYLQSQFIADSDIPGIGAAREAVLRSYGIETACDVEQLPGVRIPGFGPKLTGTLMTWRADVIRQFRFDPKTGIPPTELNSLGLKYQKLRQSLEQRLQRGPAELQSVSLQAGQDLSRLESHIQTLLLPLAQAQVDLAAMKEQ
jgi:DNA-binding helix-hairpin-helix protein with protein kinase domain